MVKCVRYQSEAGKQTGEISVVSVSKSESHTFSKEQVQEITLLTGLGVEGDAHCGKTVQHRSRVAKNPEQPNLRQVHLVQEELFSELKGKGYEIKPGDIGENITTRGVDLLSLPEGTILQLGDKALVKVTGLRNPCSQLDDFGEGLMSALIEKMPDAGTKVKSGIMGIVMEGGKVRPGDKINVSLPAEPHKKMELV